MSIGDRLRGLRKLRHLTQTQLAKSVGLDQSTISDIERGASFGAEALQRFCEVLQTTSNYIMRGGREADLWEAELLALFRALTPDDQAHMLRILRSLVASDDPGPATRRLTFKTTR